MLWNIGTHNSDAETVTMGGLGTYSSRNNCKTRPMIWGQVKYHFCFDALWSWLIFSNRLYWMIIPASDSILHGFTGFTQKELSVSHCKRSAILDVFRVSKSRAPSPTDDNNLGTWNQLHQTQIHNSTCLHQWCSWQMQRWVYLQLRSNRLGWQIIFPLC